MGIDITLPVKPSSQQLNQWPSLAQPLTVKMMTPGGGWNPGGSFSPGKWYTPGGRLA